MINLNQKQLTILIVIGGIMLLVIGYYIYSITQKNDYEQLDVISEENINYEEKSINNEEEIVVHIAGEIKTPGIIKIKEGARIADIIEKAGGLTDKANINDINLAYTVEDGQKITIPSKQDETSIESVTTKNGEGIITQNPQNVPINNKSNSTTTNSKININKASIEELQTLSGIGESTAGKIIEYRKTNGEFKQIEDIKNVPGIGDAKYEQIKENIKVK